MAIRAAPACRTQGQTIELTVEPDDLTIISDADGIIQMLQALLDNAVKFTPANGAVGLEVHADLQVGRVSLTVWDTGIGIAPEQQASIFEPFVQADGSLSRQYEGVGLGLAYVHRMVELLGGAITLTSVVGEGSRFRVELPKWHHEEQFANRQ
ncbi:MAG: hypothetical protein IPK16_28470 [Anaerolineales bacterium]|nr:hypothetical protein [Anaerolineales bacterium]